MVRQKTLRERDLSPIAIPMGIVCFTRWRLGIAGTSRLVWVLSLAWLRIGALGTVVSLILLSRDAGS